MAAVAVANSHSAKEHLLGREFQESADDLVHAYPGHLRAGVQTIAACQKRQRMNVAAEVRPLARTKPAVDRDEETNGRIEKLIVTLDLLEPSDAVFTSRPECSV